ncbi:MAG: uracil-DNA glycosylase [Microcella sp.]|uniref:uracil-DNA glycosylase n=1 Tax=Microcella sp. TaxID=1913979 RepID=UPI0027276FDA|nr:uracil-DNA glycosylase [Microcella sp.]MDO8337950.1 uracil-DNA glycosylase [Microcella sp.]
MPGTADQPNPLTGLVAPDWADALAPVADRAVALLAELETEAAAGSPFLPDASLVLRAFRTPLSEVRVLLLGQDPYPTPGHPVGLSFAVDRAVRPLPRSLVNIHRELRDDLGAPTPEHGDLSAWQRQGVLLLNRVLTVRPGSPGSHRGRGWEEVTGCAVRALAERGGPLVAILWGRDAQSAQPLLGDVPVVASAHPSPLSARTGFFGSRPFSRANALLVGQGGAAVDWTLPA